MLRTFIKSTILPALILLVSIPTYGQELMQLQIFPDQPDSVSIWVSVGTEVCLTIGTQEILSQANPFPEDRCEGSIDSIDPPELLFANFDGNLTNEMAEPRIVIASVKVNYGSGTFNDYRTHLFIWTDDDQDSIMHLGFKSQRNPASIRLVRDETSTDVYLFGLRVEYRPSPRWTPLVRECVFWFNPDTVSIVFDPCKATFNSNVVRVLRESANDMRSFVGDLCATNNLSQEICDFNTQALGERAENWLDRLTDLIFEINPPD